MENSGSQAPVPLGESQPQVPQNAGIDQSITMVAQKRPWLRSLEFAALALAVLILLVVASYIFPFVAVLEALNMAAPFVGIIFTLSLAIGCGEIVWQEFRRTNSGQTERAGSFDSTVKIGIILMIIGVPLLFLGIGALVLLAGIILLIIGFKRGVAPGLRQKPAPGAAKYVLTGLIALIGGLAGVFVALVAYIIIWLRWCEITNSKCL